VSRLIVDSVTLTSLVWLVAPARQDQFFTQAAVPSISSTLDGASAYDDL